MFATTANGCATRRRSGSATFTPRSRSRPNGAERPDLKPYVGRQLTVIAWLWARTVKSPNPAFARVDVPLASTFMLSSKPGKEAYVEPAIEAGRLPVHGEGRKAEAMSKRQRAGRSRQERMPFAASCRARQSRATTSRPRVRLAAWGAPDGRSSPRATGDACTSRPPAQWRRLPTRRISMDPEVAIF